MRKSVIPCGCYQFTTDHPQECIKVPFLFICGDKMINFHSKESSTSFSYPPRGWFLCFHLDFYSTLYNKWIRALSPVTDSFYDHSGWWDKEGASKWMFAECCADNGEGERWKILISPKYPQQKAIIASTLILALSHPGALFLLHGRPTKRPKYHTGTRKTQIITAELLLTKSHKESVPFQVINLPEILIDGILYSFLNNKIRWG